MRDLRYAFRSLARTPVFAVTAVVILSLSVGAATAVFSLLHALVLRPLPVPNPHELVQLTTINDQGRSADLTWAQYRALAARHSVFSAIVTSIQQGVFTVKTDDATPRASVSGVSGGFYRELGAHPALGRLIEPSDADESTATAEPVAVLGWGFWQQHFGADPSVLGRPIQVEGIPLTIIGVAPKDFLGLGIAIEHDVTVPIPLVPEISQSASMIEGTVSWVATTGRLRPGVALAEARAQIEALWPDLLRETAPAQLAPAQREEYLRRRVAIESGATGVERTLRRRYTQPLYILQAITAIVLLIAGANLCALIVARAEGRRHELTVRLALGSGRGRVIRALAAEGALLGIGGAAGGLALGGFATQTLAALLLRDYLVRTSLDTSPGWTVVAAAALASLAIAAGVSAISGWMVTRPCALTLAPGASRTFARSARVGQALVGAQVALSVVLLAHASLLARNAHELATDDGGLTRETVLEGAPTELVGAYRNVDPAAYYRQALDRVRAVPGVAAAAFSTWRPEGGALPTEPVSRAGTTIGTTDPTAEVAMISPGFFETMGVSIVRGRDVTFADTATSRKIAIVSEQLERSLFGAGQGLGRHLRISRRPDWQEVEIVGIARDARTYDVRGGNRAIAYTAALQSGAPAHYKHLVVRAPEVAAPGIQRAIEALGVEYIPRLRTLDYVRSRTLLQEHLMAGLSSFFAALALMLVSVGVYGLLSYVLSLRRKEFGIRLALGAHPGRIAGQVAGSVTAVMAAGLVLGLAGTFLTSPLLRSVMVATSPYDPIAIGRATLIMLVGGTLAAAAPALRASRVEPVAELRRD